MKNKNSLWTTIRATIEKPFWFFAAICSIIGLFIGFIQETYAVIIALSVFCILLLVFFYKFLRFLHDLFNFEGDEDRANSTFVKYETADSSNIIFETYKLIQSKRPVLIEKDWNFKWSGTVPPKISSETHEVIDVMDLKNPDHYDKAILKFKKPLRYNETAIAHIKCELNDSDHKSKTHVEMRINYEVDIIHFRIILKYKKTGQNHKAVLERKKTDSQVNSDYEKLETIAFDDQTKSFEYNLMYPEVGYFYRIRWDR